MKKTIIGIVAIVAIIAILGLIYAVYAQGWLDTDSCGFEQTLYANGDNNPYLPNDNLVTFTECALDRFSDNSIPTVFASVFDDLDIVFYEDANGDCYSWTMTKHEMDFPQSLSEMVSGTYYIQVDNDCMLII